MEPTETGLRHRARRVARQISTQHRHLNPLFEALQDALVQGEAVEAQQACARFRDALDAHFSLEDEFFFPALHGLCPDRAPELSGLSRDHQRLLSELARLAAAVEGAELEQAARVLESFASTLSSHEHREEQLVSSINALADVARAD